tara:strand:- start:94 stop:1275 length:1182 start_codon:yes stop_codon:yes gene_type:complete
MRKIFIYILFFTFVFLNQANAMNLYKYPSKNIDGSFCTDLLNQFNSPNFPYERDSPFLTYVDLEVEDINRIDGKNMEFESFFSLWIRWKDPRIIDSLKKLDTYEETEKPAWLCDYQPNVLWGEARKVFDPTIEFFNRKTKPNFQTGLVDWVDIYSNGTIETRLRDSATFMAKNFDFRRFPFDSQTLTFELYSEYPSTIISIEPDEVMEEYKNTLYEFEGDDGINIPGWKLKSVEYETYEYVDTDEFPYKGFHLYLNVERVSSFYIYKIILPIMFIWAISWSVFWVRGSQIDAKVNVTIVCLLALIAYNFIIDEDLPKLSYLTFLDSFILLSYFFTGIATILCVYSYVRHTKSGKDLTIVDQYAHFLGPLLYFLSIAAIGIYFYSFKGALALFK